MPRLACCLVLLLAPSVGRAADAFDRHTSDHLRGALDDGKPIDELSMKAAAKLGTIGRNVGGPVLVVRTNDGNLAKMVVAWGFRRTEDGLRPVVMLERTVTYRADRRDVTRSSDENVMLFGGFAYNLDIGQVVPEGQGGDIAVTSEGELVPLGNAVITPLEESRLPAVTAVDNDPHDHEGVLPRDFAGTWQIDVDGRWSGELVLAVDGAGRVSGRYTSAESKSSYDVSGRIAAVPHRIKLDFQLDNVRQEVDAFLWTKDKSRMAGTANLAGRPFGFRAERAETEDEE